MRTLTLIAFLFTAALVRGQACSDIFISEYSPFVAGVGHAYVEVYNPTDQIIDLSGYELRSYLAPPTTPSMLSSTLSGTIAPGEARTFSMDHTIISQRIKDKADMLFTYPSAIISTGDDAVALFHGTDTLDIIGVVGVDPGTAWSVTGTNGVNGTTIDNVLIRDKSVQEGTTNWSVSSGQWMVFPYGVDTYMGFHEGTCFTEQLSVIVNFDSTVTGINNGQYNGSGFTATPSVGQLNSNSWAINGFADGTLNYGGAQTGNDFAKGTFSTSVTSGGLYAFTTSTGDNAWGVQPTGDDFTPGTVSLRIQNTTGATLENVNIGYELWVRNDATRGNSFNFSYSTGSGFINIGTFNYTSPDASVSGWTFVPRSTRIEGLSIAPGDYFTFRWSGDDVSGSGSRDEFAIDDIYISSVDSASYAGGSCTPDVLSESMQICTGDSVMLGGSYQSLAGTYSDTLINVGGCDSIINTTLSLLPLSNTTGTVSICQGDSIMINGNYQSTAGIYSYTLANVLGCDSTVDVTLNVIPIQTTSETADICQGDSLFVGGQYQTASGVYHDTLVSVTGCDSVITTTLSVAPQIVTNSSVSFCPGDSALVHGQYVTAAGTYSDTSQAISSCDSISVITVTLSSLPTTPVISSTQDSLFTGSGFSGYQWYLNGTPISGATNAYYIATQSGNYTVVVSNAAGCEAESTITHTHVGISTTQKIDFIIYPNPSNDRFTIELPTETTDYILEIQDISGRVVFSRNLNTVTTVVDESLSKGLYTVSIHSKQTRTSRLVVIQ